MFLLVGALGSYPDGEAAEECAFMQLPVLFVMSDLCVCGNGLAVSVRRMTMLLRERGHDVRVLSAPPSHGDDCGVGALEVLRHGVVPVLASGSLMATSQFALSAESAFEAGNPRSLARAIDAWIDRGDEARRSEAARYREVGQRYNIRSCVGELERVYGGLVTGGEFPGRESDREEEM